METGEKAVKTFMGEVIDEETGDKAACIFCNLHDDCPHLVAIIDKTFTTCNGGALYEHIGKLETYLTDIILGIKEATGYINQSELGFHFSEIYQVALRDYDPKYPEFVYIDQGIFFEWLNEALIKAGAEESTGYFVEEGGPGQSSALSYLYAQNPKVVVESVVNTLNDIRLKFNPRQSDTDTDTDTKVIPQNRTQCEKPKSSLKILTKKDYVGMPSGRLRTVLIVVTEWPGGTMAMKFGYALRSALGVTEEKMILVQMAPESIFRVETKVSEADFITAMSLKNVSCRGSILFIEIPMP
jgi:hypothetical protein